jgi:membrane protease YdiL (CAAX protease family)
MINEIASVILQLLLFTLIPFLVYCFKFKKAKGFLNYIGIKNSNNSTNAIALLAGLVLSILFLIIVFINEEFKMIFLNPESVTGKIKLIDNKTLAAFTILMVAIFKTALAEEILFRGFIAKRLIFITNFYTGNIIQSLIFGAIHVLLFITITQNLIVHLIMFLFTSIIAYISAYLNEKKANGSILPGIIIHSTSNIISYSTVYFMF